MGLQEVEVGGVDGKVDDRLELRRSLRVNRRLDQSWLILIRRAIEVSSIPNKLGETQLTECPVSHIFALGYM